MSSGPMPRSSKVGPSSGREKNRIHQITATKYPIDGTYLPKDKNGFPIRETPVTNMMKAPEMRANPTMTLSSQNPVGSESAHDKTNVSIVMPRMPHRKRNSALRMNAISQFP